MTVTTNVATIEKQIKVNSIMIDIINGRSTDVMFTIKGSFTNTRSKILF